MNINQWYLVTQEYMSNYGGNNGYVRAYARCTQQDTENVRSYVEVQCRFYVEQYYVISGKPTGGSISCTGLNTSASGDAGGRYNAGETVIASSGGWVSHDAEGNKTITVSANMYTVYNGVNKTATGSITLPKIEVAPPVPPEPPVVYAENLLIYKNGSYLDTNIYVKNNGQFLECELYRKVNGQFIK